MLVLVFGLSNKIIPPPLVVTRPGPEMLAVGVKMAYPRRGAAPLGLKSLDFPPLSGLAESTRSPCRSMPSLPVPGRSFCRQRASTFFWRELIPVTCPQCEQVMR
jgi:hypothetical protein